MAFNYTSYNDWGLEYNRLRLTTAFSLPFLASTEELVLIVNTDGNIEARPLPTSGGGGAVYTASSAGGTPVFKGKTGNNFVFKGLTAGPNIELGENVNDIRVAVTGLSTVATSGNYNDLSNKPPLFDGNYNSLTNKPTIPDAVNLIAGSNITISGTYPNKTISASGGPGSAPDVAPLEFLGRQEGSALGTPERIQFDRGFKQEGNKLISGATYSARMAGITGTGDKTSSLQALANNTSQAVILLDEKQGYTINGSLNLQGKRVRFENGAYFTGTGSITNILVEAEDKQQIFTTSLTVSGLNTTASVMWWGAKQDTITDTYPAFIKAVAFFPSYKKADVYFPAGDVFQADENLGPYYYFGTNIGVIERTVRVHGDGVHSQLLMNGTQLGIQLAGDGSVLEDFTLAGNTARASVSINSSAAHGIWISSHSRVTRIFVRNFDGDGIRLVGDVNRGTNANKSTIEYCHAKGNGRAGFYTEGGDSNTTVIQGNYSEGNARFGFWMSDFLGNVGVMNSTQANANGHNYNKTVVNHNGKVWNALNDNIGVEPGTNDTWAEVIFNAYFPQNWNSTTQYYSGSGWGFYGNNAMGVYLSTYFEFDEYPVIQSSNNIIIGGNSTYAYGTKPLMIYGKQGTISSLRWQALNKAATSYVRMTGDGRFWGPSIQWGDDEGREMHLGFIGDKLSFTLGNLGASSNLHFAGYTDETGQYRIKSQHYGGLDIGDLSFNNIAHVSVGSSAPTNTQGIDNDICLNIGGPTSIISWRKISGAWVAITTGSGGSSYSFPTSVTESSGAVSLIGDQSAPGTSKYYGTNASGTKGFYDLPAGGGGGTSSWTVSGNDQYANTTGSVGIGTNAPTEAKLHIIGGSAHGIQTVLSQSPGYASFFSQTYHGLNTARYHILAKTVDQTVFSVDHAGNAYARTLDLDGTLSVSIPGLSSFAISHGSGFTRIATQGNFDLTLGVNGGDNVILKADGNFGIGASPTQKLDVDGQVRIRGGSPGAGKVLTSDANGVGSWQNPSTGSTYTANNAITQSGNIFQLGGPLIQDTVIGDIEVEDNSLEINASSFALNAGNIYLAGNLHVSSAAMTLVGLSTTYFDQKLMVDALSGEVSRVYDNPYTIRSANYTTTSSDETVETTTAGITITIRSAIGIKGKKFGVKNTSSGDITIAFTGGQTVFTTSAQTSISLPVGGFVELQSNGVNYILR